MTIEKPQPEPVTNTYKNQALLYLRQIEKYKLIDKSARVPAPGVKTK